MTEMYFSTERTALRALAVSMLVLTSHSVHGGQLPPLTTESLRKGAQWPFEVEKLFRTGIVSSDIGDIEVSRLTWTDSPGPSILVMLSPGRFGVGGVRRVRPLSAMRVQVWILRPDGTTKPDKGATGHMGSDGAGFYFDNVPDSEIEGIIVSVDGTLFVRKVTRVLPKVEWPFPN